MQIPLSDPMAGYPQPYATWADERRNAAADQHDAVSADHSAQETTSSAFTVDVTA
jgi:hypothetical protein